MIPYFFLQFAPLLGNAKLSINNKKCSISPIKIFFFILFSLLALRSINVGADMKAYLYYFDIFSSCSFEQIVERIKQPDTYDYEVGFIAFTWLVGRLTGSFQCYIAITSLITVLPIAWLYNKEEEYQYLEIVLFIQIAIFTLMFSGIRQSIVISLSIFAYELMKKKRFALFAVYVFALTFFHKSAWLLLVLPFLYFVPIKKKYLSFVVPIMALVFIFKEQFFRIVLSFTGKYSDTKIVSTGAYLTFLLLILISIFCFVIPDENKLSQEQMGLRNFFLFSVFLQSFTSMHNTIMRVNYYFLIFVPVLVPQIIMNAKPQMKKLAKEANVIMCVFFTIAHLVELYKGADVLKIYPYQFFWEV